jgi:transposase-like protein
MIYSTNLVERLNRDFKRTTLMRGALPNLEATKLLLSGVVMSRKEYQRKITKLDYEEKKFKWDD